ncbi:hypothetical protein [Streptomyces alfalfae]|uniref:Secreted protein n=1 Tax=Streptomyces alfalfae TaxID=1642299 RepID=A0A7T4TZ01_9ACTN|nr:hypothetical protein [Streptomyces alfalfae]QQC90213.1 hypothetical protein I8755_18710 [Streptomyces alfalfae]
MSRPVPSVPRLPARLRAWFRVPLVLVAVFATALPMASASAAVPPPAALAAESGGESQHDGAETAPRPPARQGTRLPTAARPGPPRASVARALPPPRLVPRVPARRSVVLRC